MSFFTDMEKSLLEAIEIEKGNVPVIEREGMAAPTYYIADSDKELIEEINKNISKAN